MKYLFFFLSLTFLHPNCNNICAQTYQTTESKSYGSCNKAVSINSRIGMRCPHCGVRWGNENQQTTTDYSNSNSNYRKTTIPSYDFNSTIKMTKSNVNVRSGPSTSYSKIGLLPRYSSVTVISKTGSWYYVEFYTSNFYKKKGYIYAPLLY